MISICIPVYEMENKDFFLKRCLDSITNQAFKDYEIIITENGKGMASNTDEAIKKAQGGIVKILFMDDYLAHDDSLANLSARFRGGWYVSGCDHDDGINRGAVHFPIWNIDTMNQGLNTIGSPSVLAFENNEPLLFDENMTWMLDVDLYLRLFKRYGPPTITNEVDVTIGIGKHQATSFLSDETKSKEHIEIINRYNK